MARTDLTVDIDVKGFRRLKKLQRELIKTKVASMALGKANVKAGKSLTDVLNGSDGKWKRSFNDLDKIVKKFGTATLGGLRLAMKAAGAEMGLMALSLVALHGLFAAGQGIMKAWEGTLNVLSGAAAGAAVALSTVAAAMREQQAAMFAFRGAGMKGYDQFGSNINKVRVVMRGLHTDTNLAAVGVENLNAAYAAVSKESTFTRGSQTMLRGLMDFASAGQSIDKGMGSAGSLIGTLQDPKKSWSEIKAAAEAMGPQMKKAMKEATKQGINSGAELIEAINSGQLAIMGGVEGQWDAVSGTLISSLKGAFNVLRNDFADLGQQFIGPVKEQFLAAVDTFRTGMVRVWGPLVRFGEGPFLSSITGMAEKFTDVFVSLIRRGPEVEGMMGRISDRWTGFVDGWNVVLDRLRPFIEGARVLESMFGNIFSAMGKYMRESFGTFNKLLIENEDEVGKFGDRLGELFAAFGRFQNELKELFFKALPFINKILSGVRQVVDLMSGVMRGMGGIMGGLGDGAGAYGLLASAMVILSKLKNWAGGFLFSKNKPVTTQNMHVNAANVHGLAGRGTGVTAGGQLTPAQRSKYEKAAMRSARARGYSSPVGPMYTGPQSRLTRLSGLINRPLGGPSLSQGTIGTRLRAQSERWRGGRERINGSMGAKMGVGLGLGMLSSRAPEEIQGALAMGSMAAFMSPQIGVAIAGLGTATKSTNTTTGMLGGAAGGAALGAYGGPWGALGGAIVGGIYGGVMSGINKAAKERKEAEAAGTLIVAAIYDSVIGERQKYSEAQGVSALTPDALRESLNPLREASLLINDSALLKNYKDENYGTAGAYNGAAAGIAGGALLAGPVGALLGGIGGGITGFLKGRTIEKDSNKNNVAPRKAQWDAINQLKKAYPSMFDGTDLDAIRAAGTEGTFLAQIKSELNTKIAAAQMVIDKGEGKIGFLGDTLGRTTEGILNLASATGTDLYDSTLSMYDATISMSKGLMKTADDLRNASGDRAAERVDAVRLAQDQVNAPAIVDEAGETLARLLNEGGSEADILEQVTAIEKGLISYFGGDEQLAERAISNLLGVGGDAFAKGGTLEGLEKQFAAVTGLDVYQSSLGDTIELQKKDIAEGLTGSLMAGGFTGFTQAGILSQIGSSSEDLNKWQNSDLLGQYAFTGLEPSEVIALFQEQGIALENLSVATKNADEATTDTFGQAVTAFATSIDKLIEKLDGDTATPRRGMVNMRNLLSRKNSDHRFGAMDLSGSNMGATQSTIKGNGGYAEMHGRGGGRHLHAVPGEGGGEGSGSVNNYTINVTGGDSSSPGEIADEVMARIQRQSANTKERI